MVNADTPCNHDGTMRRIAGVAALALALASCSTESGRDFASYYDPQHYFVANLPAANDLEVTPPQPSLNGPGLLSGVISRPPQPSPSPSTGLGGIAVAPTETPDQTIYQALVLTTGTFQSLDQMALFFLTGDPTVDVLLEEPLRIDANEGRLLVADVSQDGTTTAGVAAAISLGRDGTGYVILAVFPPGQWSSQEDDFLRVVESFRAEVPPPFESFPMAASAA
jgi:hypothetical protein